VEGGTRQQLGTMADAERARWEEVVKAANVPAE